MPRAMIQFTCPEPGCSGIVAETLWISEPDYGVERMSDGDAIEDHDVACPVCGTDYEIETVNGLGGHYATLNGEDVSISIEHDPDPDDYEEFLLRYVPANDQEGAFERARNELLGLLGAYDPMPDSMLARMIYSQLIAIMEAYLSDKILQLTIDHTEIKKRLAQKAGFVQNQTMKLSDALLDPDKAENIFKIGLQSVLYHDLEKVEKLYQVGVNVAFFPSTGDVQNKLEAAVKTRHDCVHRNGVDKDGNVHSFDEATIRDLATQVTALVDHLEDVTKKAVDALP